MAKQRKPDIEVQADRIREIAETYGVEKNYLFLVTFDRLQDTLALLAKLRESVEETGPTVTKEYVKGRKNVCINPAVTEYNKTMKTLNDTIATLMKIIDGFKRDDEGAEEDELLAAIRGD